MRRINSIYLAGPDLWFPDARDHDRRRKALCEAAGFEGVSPLDAEVSDTEASELLAREVYADTAARIRRADALIANLTPWRGPGADASTAFAAGFASGLNKPVFAYMNLTSEDEGDYRGRVEMMLGAAPDGEGIWRDGWNCEVEDFGLPETMMLWAEARRFFVVVTPDPIGELTGLELALEAVREYAG